MGVVGVLLATALTGCGELPASEGTAPTIDTLSGGGLHVQNPRVGAWAEGEGWKLVADLRLGRVEGTGADVFGDIRSFEVDSTGRIYVLDGDAREVRVFRPDGSHERTQGRAGQGPGELSQPWGLQVDARGRLWVVDMGNQRYSVWNSDGELVDEVRRFGEGNVAPWPGKVLDDGRVIDVAYGTDGERRVRRYVVYDARGRALDSLPMPSWEQPTFVTETDRSRTTASVPFSPRQVHVFGADGTLWTGISDDYRVVHRSLTESDTLRMIEKAYDRVPVTDAEAEAAASRLAWFERQGGTLDRSRFPARHPAYQDFFVDDRGFLWTLPTVPRRGEVTEETVYAPRPPVFDVFDDRGFYLGRVEAPLPLRQTRVVGSHLYGVTSDELGVNYLVRFRVEGR